MKMKRKLSKEFFAQCILGIILLFCAFICLYPLLFVFSMSISGEAHVLRKDVTFFPKGFSLGGYELFMENPSIWVAYRNTILYTVFGTILNVVLTILTAYPLSRAKFVLRRPILAMITLTMYIGGGMIPFFIVVSQLGLYNNPLGIILPFAISAWNVIIARNFFEGIPDSLEEAARIDGASHFKILIRIMIPLSKAIIAVLTLYYAVGHWNSYFWPMVLLPKKAYQTLQLYLNNVLLLGQAVTGLSLDIGISRSAATEQMKYSMVIFAVLPILFIYPFVQKYFVQGVTVGAVKG